MTKESGYLVTYVNKIGKTQKAKMIHSEQLENFKKYKKVWLHLLNDDLIPKKK